MFRVINPAHKRLSLSGFLFLRTIFTIRGHTHWIQAIGVDFETMGSSSLSAVVGAGQ